MRVISSLAKRGIVSIKNDIRNTTNFLYTIKPLRYTNINAIDIDICQLLCYILIVMNLPNKITIMRILLVPFFIAFVLYSKLNLALLVFLIAVLSDAIDGYIARAYKRKTKLGAMLDPLADKILIISAFISFILVKDLPLAIKFPPYIPIIVISRDAIILLGAVIIYILKGDIEIKPSPLGKITTFLQMLTVIFILIQSIYSRIVWNIMIVFAIASGLEYVIRGSRVLSERA